MRKLIIGIVLVLAVIFVGTGGAGKKPSPQQVRADFNADPQGPVTIEYREITSLEARGEAGIQAATFATLATERCWYAEERVTLGLSNVYERTHIAFTKWCAIYGVRITYSSTNTRGSTNGVCRTTNTGSWPMSGGPGLSWVKKHTFSDFECDTPFWFDLHDTLWMNIAYNVWGNHAVEEKYPS